MMDSRMYPTTPDTNRKKHLTEGTKEKAETKQSSVLQDKTEEEERVNPAEPDDGPRNIASSEKKTQGSLCKNSDAKQAHHAHQATPGGDGG